MNTDAFSILNPSLSEDGDILRLDLDHGRANEMGSPQMKAWEQLTEILETGCVRAMITTSQRKSRKGKPIFIAGANVTERKDWSEQQVRSHVRWQRNTLSRLRRCPIFHIGVVDGIALGWGTEFLLACDYRIATTQSTFGLPETGLGILPGAGGTSDLWAEIGIPQALRLGMAGERIDGSEAQRIGLVQEVVEQWDAGMARANQLAELLKSRSPTATAAYKLAMLSAVGRGPNLRQGLEARAYEHCVHTGEAGIGRANFKKIIAGEEVEWGDFTPFQP
jgi:enoyl-CoA hydratase/carnithine racemase